MLKKCQLLRTHIWDDYIKSKGIKTILIDDPIQCMDDINMISFVKLLRREFSDCQIILSTHEEDFSNFIRYKFKKYDLIAQAITLKDA